MGVNPRTDEDAEYFEQEWKNNRGEQIYRYASLEAQECGESMPVCPLALLFSQHEGSGL